MTLVIETLQEHHNRSIFCSTNEALNLYLRRFAMQDQERRLSRCYVLADDASQRVLGFYTLSATGVIRSLLESHIAARKLEKYELLPAFLLGRLAVDRSISGQGFGKLLLSDALIRTERNECGGLGLLVHAKNEESMAFYKKQGFVEIEPLIAFFLRSDATLFPIS